MSSLVRRSVSEPLRSGLTWHEMWRGQDYGLIKCWENGRLSVGRKPELASAARKGELPALDWKGGITGSPKMKHKFGSLHYLATWQGLREEDLCVDLDAEIFLICSRTGIKVTFTPDLSKLDIDASERSGPESLVS